MINNTSSKPDTSRPSSSGLSNQRIPAPRNVPCPFCGELFTAKGLPTHIGVKHKQTSAQGVVHSQTSVSISTHSSQEGDSPEGSPPNVVENLQVCRNVFKNFSIIPMACRPLVTSLLAEVIEKVVTCNDESSWLSLLSFASVVLQLPSLKQDDLSLPKIVRENIVAFRGGARLEYRRKDHSSSSKSPYYKKGRDVVKAAKQKLSEGDISSAARLLSSSDEFADEEQAIDEMIRLHPKTPEDLQLPDAPTIRVPSPEITTEEITRAIMSFPKSSSGGLDGIRPRHIRDLITGGVVSDRLIKALAKLTDLLLRSDIPLSIRPIFFGARLFALKKPNGSFRPIACSSVFRRILSKILVWRIKTRVSSHVGDHQLGCGTPGGAEAAVHATSSFLATRHGEPTVLAKLDFSNAFNTVRRDHMLRVVRDIFPEYYAPIYQMYAYDSYLAQTKNVINSSNGIQQGDPLGPTLFCISIAEMVRSLKSPLNVWYMDDGALGGSLDDVLADIQKVKDFSLQSGLTLNPSKCEIWIQGADPQQSEELLEPICVALPNCKYLEKDDMILLGAPLFEESIETATFNCKKKTDVMLSRLPHIGAHRALFLLRSTIGASTLTHVLRAGHNISKNNGCLVEFEEKLKVATASLINVDLTEKAWSQATLPISKGGLGIISPIQILSSCQLSSQFSTDQLVKDISSEEAYECFRNNRFSLKELYISEGFSTPECMGSQKEWSKPVFDSLWHNLFLESNSNKDKARLMACSAVGSGSWLHAVPCASTGTLLDDESMRIAVGLRLGVSVVAEHTCICGVPVSSDGHHGLACRQSVGRRPRHMALNNILAHTLRKANIPNVLEPNGLSRTDGKRPDGLTLVPFRLGKPLVWDATVIDTLANSYVDYCAQTQGYAADLAEVNKNSKYVALREDYIFSPFAFETFGPAGKQTKTFINDICKRLRDASGSKQLGVYFKQQISLCIQRGNVASVLGTMGATTSNTDAPTNGVHSIR